MITQTHRKSRLIIQKKDEKSKLSDNRTSQQQKKQYKEGKKSRVRIPQIKDEN